MNDKVIIANYITAYEIRSVDDMERQFVLNENVLYDVAEEMWSCTLETIASAVLYAVLSLICVFILIYVLCVYVFVIIDL